MKVIVDMNEESFPCPCCDCLTLSERGAYEICPVCFWEDEDVQFNNPDFEGGANKESLKQARENYKKFNASSLDFVKEVREPFPDEINS